MTDHTILTANNLQRQYQVRRSMFSHQPLFAVRDVSFNLSAGETLAIVGESGCGKSTLARLLTMLEQPSNGSLHIMQHNLQTLSSRKKRALRQYVQMVFQNPYAALNPRHTMNYILEEPLRVNTSLNKKQRTQRVLEVIDQVGLAAEQLKRYPHMFSGGQRQRIAIARAIVLRPKIIVLDEPVSALDISVQGQILNLLQQLQQQYNLAYVFISHDLHVVKHIADRLLCMYLGEVIEYGDSDTIFNQPAHPYTQALLSATPSIHKIHQRSRLYGEQPSPLERPSGCAFHTRCPFAQPYCRKAIPPLRQVNQQQVACHYAEKIINHDMPENN